MLCSSDSPVQATRDMMLQRSHGCNGVSACLKWNDAQGIFILTRYWAPFQRGGSRGRSRSQERRSRDVFQDHAAGAGGSSRDVRDRY